MAKEIAAPGPQTRVDPAVEMRIGDVGRYVRWAGAVYGSFLLISPLVSPLEGLLALGPSNVRVMPVGAAGALSVLSWGALIAGDTRRARSATWRRFGIALSVSVALFGLYVVVVFAGDLRGLWPADMSTIPSLWLALFLLVLGVSVPLSVSRSELGVTWGQVGALLVFSATAVIFLGYLYGDVTVGTLYSMPEISFQAAIVSLLIAVGVFLIRPGSGLVATASSPGAGGRMLRRVGPVVLLLPALLLLIVETVPRSDRIDAIAFISVGLGLFLLALLAAVVGVIDETKAEALTAAAEAERARVGLEQEAPLARALAEALHIVDLEGAPDFDVATRFRPGQGTVAGDASAVRMLPDGSLGMVLVDLTGHGAEPAIQAIRVRDALIHSLAHGRSPADALAMVGWTAPSDVLASAIAVRLVPSAGTAEVASAGHPPAIWVGTQEARLVGPTGPLLYLDPDSAYGETEIRFGPGDTIVLMSDGVADVQKERDGRSEPQVIAELLLTEGGVAARTADLVLGFAAADPTDDQTVLVSRLRS